MGDTIKLKPVAKVRQWAITYVVKIFHPGYSDSSGALMHFNAPLVGGLHHATALTACQIVAGNRWDGYLTDSRGGDPLLLSLDAGLMYYRYYFYVPGEPDYPVTPRFRDWRFPRYNMPSGWKGLNSEPHVDHPQLSLQSNVLARDQFCRLSAAGNMLETTHLVPESERDWFYHNMFRQFGDPQHLADFDTILDSTTNMITLRSDLRAHFDRGNFVIIPRLDKNANTVPVAHVLSADQSLIDEHHHRTMQPLKGIKREFLFAHFAWAIFNNVQPFLIGGVERNLTILNEKGEHVTEKLSGSECRALLDKKDTNSNKRPRSSSNAA